MFVYLDEEDWIKKNLVIFVLFGYGIRCLLVLSIICCLV